MHQMFSYLGSKKRIARLYPSPKRNVVIEPFAGAAGYSTHHNIDKAILFDIDENVYNCWKFIIESGKFNGEPIRELPLLEYGEEVPDIFGKELIGFWCRRASDTPRNKLASWSVKYPNGFWGEYQRERLANDSVKCASWEIYNEQYTEADGIIGSWFIDPPYELAGRYYKHPFNNYSDLSEFAKRQKDQVIVCEEVTDKHKPIWMDFHPLCKTHLTTQRRRAQELMWTNLE